jgi:hypothetical protein
MDDTDDIYDAPYKALDMLEELDPTDSKEPWFELLEKTLDRAVKSRLERVYPAQH